MTKPRKASEQKKDTIPSLHGSDDGIKKKRVNTQTALVNSIRKKKMEKVMLHEYELEKLNKDEDKNDFMSKIKDDNATTVEGQFDMMRGLMKKTNKKSGLDMFDETEKNDEPVDEKNLVNSSEQQMSILDKVLSKQKPKHDEFKSKYEKMSEMTMPFEESKPNFIPVSDVAQTLSATKQISSATTTFTGDKDLPFIKAAISKTICMYCEREKTPKGMMIKYIVIINDKDEVIYHSATQEVREMMTEDQNESSTTGLGEATYPLASIRDHVSKILRKSFVVVGHTIFHNLIGLFGPRNVHEYKSKLRDIAVVDPNTELPLETALITNVSMIISRLLGLTNTKKMNRIETAISILKSYKLHAKTFDQYSKKSTLDLLGFEERQLIKREHKANYQQKYMTTINNNIDHLMAQMKNK